jgi:hypothetical protein
VNGVNKRPSDDFIKKPHGWHLTQRLLLVGLASFTSDRPYRRWLKLLEAGGDSEDGGDEGVGEERDEKHNVGDLASEIELATLEDG